MDENIAPSDEKKAEYRCPTQAHACWDVCMMLISSCVTAYPLLSAVVNAGCRAEGLYMVCADTEYTQSIHRVCTEHLQSRALVGKARIGVRHCVQTQ